MCIAAAPLMLAASAVQAVGAVASGMSAMSQGKYEAKVAEANARAESDAAREQLRIGKDEAADRYRQLGRVKGQQLAAMAANGIDVDYGSAVRLQEDTKDEGRIDVERIYRNTKNAAQGHVNQAANYRAEGQAAKAKGKSAFYSSLFEAGGTLLGGAAKFKEIKAKAG